MFPKQPGSVADPDSVREWMYQLKVIKGGFQAAIDSDPYLNMPSNADTKDHLSDFFDEIFINLKTPELYDNYIAISRMPDLIMMKLNEIEGLLKSKPMGIGFSPDFMDSVVTIVLQLGELVSRRLDYILSLSDEPVDTHKISILSPMTERKYISIYELIEKLLLRILKIKEIVEAEKRECRDAVDTFFSSFMKKEIDIAENYDSMMKVLTSILYAENVYNDTNRSLIDAFIVKLNNFFTLVTKRKVRDSQLN